MGRRGDSRDRERDARSEARPSRAPERQASPVVSSQAAGQTLAALVRELVPGTSWSRAREWCRAGRVLVDGEPATDPASRPAAENRIELAAEGERPAAGPAAAVEILHADADLVVVAKPVGVLTVPFAPGDRDTLLTLTQVALRRRAAARGGGGRRLPPLRAVQRLDKETSGLVVFARNVVAQRHLQGQLAAGTLSRRYLGLVHGDAESATHDTFLLRDRGDGLRGSWGRFHPARGEPPPTARRAVTHVERLERLAGASLVACRLETGRQHQIRIHLAEAGHPLVGERVYVRDYRAPLLPAPRPMLHAAGLAFLHPATGRELDFELPPPADFAAVLARLRG